MARAVSRYFVAARALLAAVAALPLVLSGTALAESRVALVVGNGGYDPVNISRLDNPVNDARLMAKTLETVGFDVSLVTDADRDAMNQAIEMFGKRLKREGKDAVGLFYYAGHGVEWGGRNYLIPLGAQIDSAMEFQGDAVPAQWVVSWMEAAGNRLNLLILDACRNNPYGDTRGSDRGLARMDAPSGSLIAYSAGPGKAANDGEGANSPYTSALAEVLIEPGLKVEDVFKRVRVRVEIKTGGEQTPWENSSLKGDFYFVLRPADKEVTDDSIAQRMATEREFWASIKDSRNPAEFEVYLEKYGNNGEFASLAQIRMAELTAAMKSLEERLADDAAYARARSKGTLLAYLRYMQEFPQGNHLFLKNTGSDFPDLSGIYDIATGTNPDGSKYGGIVTISKPDETGYRYCLQWKIANTKQEEYGCGDLEIDFTRKTLVLSVDWGAEYPVIYDVSDSGDSFVGRWHSGAGRENLERRQ